MSDATFPCPVCGASLPARAKFCGECGTPIRGLAAATTPRAPTGNPILPWFIAGVAVIAIQTVAVILALRPPAVQTAGVGDAQPTSAPFVQGGGAPTGRPAPDISQMTPRQAADRLFDRIARASEQGDTGQVRFFGPMALQAYANATPLDIDARLHIGMIDLALGELDAARAQADSITRENRTHLFGSVLRARIAEARGDRAAAKQAYTTFLANYDAEIRKNLPEYNDHTNVLNETRNTGRQAVAR